MKKIFSLFKGHWYYVPEDVSAQFTEDKRALNTKKREEHVSEYELFDSKYDQYCITK